MQPEKATNYSVGFVVRGEKGLGLTFDMFQVEVRNRIAATSTFYGTINGQLYSQAIVDAIIANGNVLDPEVTASGEEIHGSTASCASMTCVRKRSLNAASPPASARPSRPRVAKPNRPGSTQRCRPGGSRIWNRRRYGESRRVRLGSSRSACMRSSTARVGL